MIVSNAARTAAASRRFRATTPASVLCGTSGAFQLQHDREARILRRSGRLVGRVHELVGDDGYAVERQHRLGLALGQHGVRGSGRSSRAASVRAAAVMRHAVLASAAVPAVVADVPGGDRAEAAVHGPEQRDVPVPLGLACSQVLPSPAGHMLQTILPARWASSLNTGSRAAAPGVGVRSAGRRGRRIGRVGQQRPGAGAQRCPRRSAPGRSRRTGCAAGAEVGNDAVQHGLCRRRRAAAGRRRAAPPCRPP